MYQFQESFEQRQVRESVRKFALEVIGPEAGKLDQEQEFSVELTKRMNELGLLGAFVCAHFGGAEMNYLCYVTAVEELARIDSSQAATVAAHNSLGVGPIYYFGTKEQKERFLPGLCSGGLWAFGQTEPNAGSDVQGCKTKAEYDEAKEEWTLNGSKIFITNADTPLTKGVTVLAVTGKADDKVEFTSFLVPIDSPGLSRKTMHNKLCWRSSNTAELYFSDVKVPSANVLGTRGQGFKIMMQTLDRGRLSIAAMGVGLAQGCLDRATQYSKERKQFGKPLCEQQSIAFALADMATRIEAARMLLYKACWLCQEGLPFGTESSMAKLYSSEVAEDCSRTALHIFGGYGLMEETGIARLFRDAMLLPVGEGTSEIQRIVISRALLK